MINLIVYETATGRVTRQLTVFDEYERDQNLREDESYLLGSVNPSECYVKDGEVKYYPAKPASYMTFDFATETWMDARTPAEVSEHLAEAREEYLYRINTAIGTVRAKYITVIAGQDMIYLRKEQEAISYINATNPVLSQYPMIAAEVGITAPTPYEVAQIWLYMSNAWQYVAAGLEAVRMTATNAVLNATTEEQIVTACTTFEATLVAMGI